MSEIPWVGLAAIVLMFLIPLLPESLFEGRRTVKHWPRRHVCGECGAPWADGHDCQAGAEPASEPLKGELRRIDRRSLSRREW
ncbi:MAG TPA: hypothetical protein VJ966_18140 [Actinomycetes bacterium]|nr:hypothetical protein [Actinomycetes bacterium]